MFIASIDPNGQEQHCNAQENAAETIDNTIISIAKPPGRNSRRITTGYLQVDAHQKDDDPSR